MNHTDDVQQIGLPLLEALTPASVSIQDWQSFLINYTPDPLQAEEPYVWLSCVRALMAVNEGNYGIGCLLIDPDGAVLIHDHNRSFYPRLRTDLHAEMVVLNRWEENRTAYEAGAVYTLYSSLEPCPMCLSRLITSDIRVIKYVADDALGGMLRIRHRLPPIFVDYAQRQSFGQATCSKALRDAALQILHINMDELNKRLR